MWHFLRKFSVMLDSLTSQYIYNIYQILWFIDKFQTRIYSFYTFYDLCLKLVSGDLPEGKQRVCSNLCAHFFPIKCRYQKKHLSSRTLHETWRALILKGGSAPLLFVSFPVHSIGILIQFQRNCCLRCPW